MILKVFFQGAPTTLSTWPLNHASLVCWTTFSCTISFNSSESSFSLLHSFISKNLGIDGLNLQVGEVHSLAMMFHRLSGQKLKAFVVLDELKVKEALRLQELTNHFLTFFISPKKSNLNFVIFLRDEKFLHLYCFIELFGLPLCLCSFIHSLD